jgi:TPR repeat protein
VSQWYERAYDDGSVHAGLVFAQLVLDPLAPTAQQQQPKAVRALEDAARAGFSHAQVLLTRQYEQAASRAAATPAMAALTQSAQGALHGARPMTTQYAAMAQHAGLDALWFARRWADYLRLALPQARALVDEHGERGEPGELRRFAPDEITLLSRCARLLDPALDGVDGAGGVGGVGGVGDAAGTAPVPCDPGELAIFWELAAAEHDPHAQLALGLRSARMRVDGRRIGSGDAHAAHVANFKRAIRWLTLAGEQGLAEAWYALSRICIKPEFSQRNVADAQRYLERAAEMGYRDAQLECGHNAWRARRENENNDVRAVYWLQKAAQQDAPDAAGLLHKIAPRLSTTPYTDTGALLALHAGALAMHPLLAARLELAQLFNLSRPEALLLDVVAADQGHCLVIDIRASYGRSKRRLMMVAPGPERQALDRIVRLFDPVDCGPAGPEGNYRQRLYRLRTLLNIAQPDSDDGAGTNVELAA